MATNTLDNLPDEYFELVRMKVNNSSTTNTGEAIEMVTGTKDMIRFVIKSEFLPDMDDSQSFGPLLSFPDRENYLKCKHPGSSDDYLLYLEFDIYTFDGIEYQIDNLVWEENVSKGAI